MNYYISVLKQYAVFSGRARRKEYWMFTLISTIISSIISAIVPSVGGLYSLLVLVPTLAVTVRRLHDTGRRGWWILYPAITLLINVIVATIIFVSNDYSLMPLFSNFGGAFGFFFPPAIALIILLVFMSQDSQQGENRYGPNPKEGGDTV
ncbi:MAG: DUF805 domain-containing protein [Salinispira sp.]